MKLSRASGYSLQALVAMAAADDGTLVASQLTAQAEGIPDRFLLKLLGALVKAGILDSQKGQNGGYRLAKPPSKTTLLEIIEAVDGPLRSTPLHLRGKGTDALDKQLETICQRVTEETCRQLVKVTLAELMKSKAGKR
jgi:Rrf2 family protein